MPRRSNPAVLNIANWIARLWAVIGAPTACGLAMEAGRHLGTLYLIGVGLASSWLFYRLWRMGVRFDEHGITIRRFLKADRLKWPEVSHLADARVHMDFGAGKAGDAWVLAVVLRSGRAINVEATAGRQKPGLLAAIAEVASRYQIPVQVSGQMPAIDALTSGAPEAQSRH